MKGKEFNRFMLAVAKILENRTIQHPKTEKMKEFGLGLYNPAFAVISRDGGEIVCVWCGNRRKDRYTRKDGKRVLAKAGEPEIARLGGAKIKKGLDCFEYDDVALKVLHYLESYYPNDISRCVGLLKGDTE